MRSDCEFFIRLAPPITPAEIAQFALNIRTLYTDIVLKKVGSRLQRENHERNSMSPFEDQMGFECFVPPIALREQVIMQSVEVGFLTSEAHGTEYVGELTNRLADITDG